MTQRRKRIVVLGGYGSVGRRLCRLLLRDEDCQLVIAGRNPDRADALISELAAPEGQFVAGRGDTGDPEGLTRLLPGASLVVVAAPCFEGVRGVAGACLAAGADYVDILSRSRVRRELEAALPEIERSGRLFATHGGVGVGIPSLLVRAVKDALPGCREIRLGLWISLKGVARPEEAFDLVDAAAEFQPLLYRDGEWRRVSRARERVLMDFGPGFGRRDCLPVDLPELHGLPEQLGLHALAAYGATPNWRADVLFRAMASAAYGVKEGLGRDIFARVLLRVARRAAARSGASFVAEARGDDGREYRFRASHEDVLDWTAAMLAVFVRQYIAGSLSAARGLRMFGQTLDPAAAMRELQALGMRWDVSS